VATENHLAPGVTSLASGGAGHSRLVDLDALPSVGTVVGATAGNGEGDGFVDGGAINEALGIAYSIQSEVGIPPEKSD
jgi:hypothetical protein